LSKDNIEDIKNLSPKCAKCPVGACYAKVNTDKIALEKVPRSCPMVAKVDLIQRSMSEYDKSDIKEFARQASIQEFECYEKLPDGLRPKNPRIVELIEFARKCKFQKLGLVFCTGLSIEARILTEVLENKGFNVSSVKCKVGGIPKERIGVKPEEKIWGPDVWESMCNPILQASIMNEEQVDLAILLGLCIGHDTLFIKYCRVPVTILAVKDRVTGHNPLAPLYTSSSYYNELLSK
jgi:uncharacterized metal-binding protein